MPIYFVQFTYCSQNQNPKTPLQISKNNTRAHSENKRLKVVKYSESAFKAVSNFFHSWFLAKFYLFYEDLPISDVASCIYDLDLLSLQFLLFRIYDNLEMQS